MFEDRKQLIFFKKRGLCLVFFMLMSVLGSIGYCPFLYADETVRIKILAINPSQTDSLSTVIRHSLPHEIAPEDVVDLAGMQIEYNKEHRCYDLVKDIELAPKEVRTLVVRVKNIWFVSPERIDQIRSQLNTQIEALKDTQYYETGRMLAGRLEEKLNMIQEGGSRDLGISRRIALHRAQNHELEQIASQSRSVSALRRLQDEQKYGVRTAKFVINAFNQDNEARTLAVTAVLPKDITPENLIDRLGFSLLYEKEHERFILEKEDAFGPNESKKYEIIVRDIWFIRDAELDLLKSQKDALLTHLQNTMYENYSINIGQEIDRYLDMVKTSQSDALDGTVESRIRAFSINTQRVETVKAKIKDLQDLLLELPIKTNPTAIEQITSAIKKFREMLGTMLDMDFQPNLATTWWIILGIIAFLFIMSASFYVNWIVRLSHTKYGQTPKITSKEKPENAEMNKQTDSNSNQKSGKGV